ncbi:hypothetical protein G7Y79_00032g067010 [Physcia stellaris]|nr:hypothetical protein G7Y79_00032g067010 [Physcia stellaris]
MSSTYDTWMQRMLNEADDHVATVEEWQALLDYLNRNITAEEAASKYTKQVAKSEDRETVYIWTLLQDVAKDFPQAHVKIIELLKAHLPPLDHKGRNPKSGEGEFWNDLPNFEFVLREHVDGLEAAAIRGADGVKTRQFINICLFNARTYHDGLLPLAQWALMLCGQAFEKDYFDEDHKQALYLQAAAQYLMLNAPKIYQLSATDDALPQDAQATATELAKKMADTMAESDL